MIHSCKPRVPLSIPSTRADTIALSMCNDKISLATWSLFPKNKVKRTTKLFR